MMDSTPGKQPNSSEEVVLRTWPPEPLEQAVA